MSAPIRTALLSVCLLICALGGSAQAVPLTLKRGVNFEAWQHWTKKTDFISNWYDRTNYPDWTKAINDTALAALQAQGFDYVRLNVDPSPLMWDEKLAPDLVESVVKAVNRLRKAGLKVVVDLHMLPEADDRPNGVHYVLATGGERSTTGFRQFLSVARLFASRLSALPPSEVALELINEPDQDWFSRGPSEDRWPSQLRELYLTARRVAPDMTLILTGGRSGGIEGLLRLDPTPYGDDPNIIWSFHFYEPMIVTHSGLPWESNANHFLRQVPFPASNIGNADRQRLLQGAAERINAELADSTAKAAFINNVQRAIDAYIASGESGSTIDRKFDAVSNWAKKYNIAPDRITLGEFGAFQDTLDQVTRANILRAMRQSAEGHGFSWAIYTAGLTAGPRSFGIMANPASTNVDVAIVEALGLAPVPQRRAASVVTAPRK